MEDSGIIGKRTERDGGYCSIEEHMQDCIDFFRLLQQCDEGQALWENPGAIEGTKPGESPGAEEFFRKLTECILVKERRSTVFLPAPYMRDRCKLSETEYWLALFAFCCEMESGLCLQFWKEYSNMWPTLQYALHLLSYAFSVDFALAADLCSQGLPIGDILQLSAEGENNRGILQQPLLLSRTAFYFLLTGSFRQEQWCELYAQDIPDTRKESADSPAESYIRLHEEEYAILSKYLRQNSSLHILINGRQGSGKRTLLKRLVLGENRKGILIKMPFLYKAEVSLWEEMSKSLNLLHSLAEPVVILDFQGMGYGNSGKWEEQNSCLEAFLKNRWDVGTVFFLIDRMENMEALRKYSDIRVDIEEFLSMEEKKLLLDALVKPGERGQWQDALLGRYVLNVGELIQKWKTINHLSGKYNISLKEQLPWVEGIQETTIQNSLGRIVENHNSLEDLVVSRECRRQLETVIKLSENWFGRTTEWQGKREGLQILFHGTSGTGKTMAASVLAASLRLPLFKVDLSRIFDKYIGETEKHLDDIFHMAQRGSYILFFDEADALFSKRMGIQDSHDKYANATTAYLLQRMEVFDGILILATNLIDHLDDAFLRRIQFVIKFKNLEIEDRALLWERLLTGAALSEDISIQALAQAAELSPARIRVAVQTARMLASSENSRQLTKEHFRIALELETGKDETAFNY